MGDFDFKFKNMKVKLWLKNKIRNSKNEMVNLGHHHSVDEADDA